MKMARITTIIKAVVVCVVLMYGAWLAFKWTAMRVYVGPHQALIITSKFGRPLPAELVVAPAGEGGYKGVQEEVRGPGRYFLDPVRYDYEHVALTEISAGDPAQWQWKDDGSLKDPATAPQIGVVSLKQGKTAAVSSEVVEVGYKGIQKDVLTPGTYKLNPYLYDVTIERAVIVPPGSVGVVTRLVGDIGQVSSATLTQIRANTTGPATQPGQEVTAPSAPTRLVVGATQRGILKDVLQPGIYYLNPRMMKVSIVPVGYD